MFILLLMQSGTSVFNPSSLSELNPITVKFRQNELNLIKYHEWEHVRLTDTLFMFQYVSSVKDK